jgi:hypothetical protein
MRPGRVRGRHPANRAELSTRRIYWEPQTGASRSPINLSAEYAHVGANTSALSINFADAAESAQVENHSRSDRPACHAATRAAWHDRLPAIMRPPQKDADVVGVERHGNGCWRGAADTSGLGIHGACVFIRSECTVEPDGPLVAHRDSD